VALVNTAGERATRSRGPLADGVLPLDQLLPGEWILERRTLQIPRSAAGEYRVQIRVETPDTTEFLSDVARISVEAPQRRFDAPPLIHALRARFGEQFLLLGYEIEFSKPDQTVQVVLYWQALMDPVERLTVFVHLVDASGQLVAQSDAEPAHGARPTDSWVTGEVVADPHVITLPPNLPAGSYNLVVGWYRPTDGHRLPVTQDGEALGNQAVLDQPVVIDADAAR